MASVVYRNCTYLGGFAGMRESDRAVLEFTDERFALVRPRSLVPGRIRRIWAKWSAVVGAEVGPAPSGHEGALLTVTTKARGTGNVVVPGVDRDSLWEALLQFGDLAERFGPEGGAGRSGPGGPGETGGAEPDEGDEDDEGAAGPGDEGAAGPGDEGAAGPGDEGDAGGAAGRGQDGR